MRISSTFSRLSRPEGDINSALRRTLFFLNTVGVNTFTEE
jgi:hypothetical protein